MPNSHYKGKTASQMFHNLNEHREISHTNPFITDEANLNKTKLNKSVHISWDVPYVNPDMFLKHMIVQCFVKYIYLSELISVIVQIVKCHHSSNQSQGWTVLVTISNWRYHDQIPNMMKAFITIVQRRWIW